MRSSLEIYDLAEGTTRVVHQTDDVIEAPNWSTDGAILLVNGGGRLMKVPVAGGALTLVNTGDCTRCNNDHGISPDGRRIVISSHLEEGSCIFVLPWEGGEPQRVTPNVPSYWHGWSPDGETLAYCAKRDGQFDICTIPVAVAVAVAGGEETRLTGQDGHEGHNDGPDYSADGRWIWFNSDRTGHAQLWRMRTDGSETQQMTDDPRVNWFPHPSPDGRHVLYLSYPPGTTGHPADLDVILRLMPAEGGKARDLLAFNGGQGTINVPCWAPDSHAFAFVRYHKG